MFFEEVVKFLEYIVGFVSQIYGWKSNEWWIRDNRRFEQYRKLEFNFFLLFLLKQFNEFFIGSKLNIILRI